MIPKPMTDPCTACSKQQSCVSSDTYKCPLFHDAFVRAWDETVTFLKSQLYPDRKETS